MVRNWSIRKPHRKTSTHLIESVTIWFLINFYFEHLVNGLMTTSLEKNIKSGKTYSGIFKTNYGASWKKRFLNWSNLSILYPWRWDHPFLRWKIIPQRSTQITQHTPRINHILDLMNHRLWIMSHDSCDVKNCNFKVFKWWSLNFTKSSLSENLRK